MTDEDLRNFFPLPRVMSGIFQLCQKLFGVHFEEVKSNDVRNVLWHKDVSLYQIIDEKSGRPLGNFFFDPYIRFVDNVTTLSSYQWLRGGVQLDIFS